MSWRPSGSLPLASRRVSLTRPRIFFRFHFFCSFISQTHGAPGNSHRRPEGSKNPYLFCSSQTAAPTQWLVNPWLFATALGCKGEQPVLATARLVGLHPHLLSHRQPPPIIAWGRVEEERLGLFFWLLANTSPLTTWMCCKLPRYVPYKCTHVPYNGTFGAPDQEQTLDVWGWHLVDVYSRVKIHRFTISFGRKSWIRKILPDKNQYFDTRSHG